MGPVGGDHIIHTGTQARIRKPEPKVDAVAVLRTGVQARRSSHGNDALRAYTAQSSLAAGGQGNRTFACATQGRPEASLNLARFDLVTFHLVILCAEHGSLCEAARAAHMSKSAASNRISALEGHLGKKLFHRHHSGLQPTKAGAICVARIRIIIDEVRGLGSAIASL